MGNHPLWYKEISYIDEKTISHRDDLVHGNFPVFYLSLVTSRINTAVDDRSIRIVPKMSFFEV